MTKRTWWIDAHHVTGDPYLSGNVNDAVFDWGGTLIAVIRRGALIVKAYNEGTGLADDPDYQWGGSRDDGPMRIDGALDEAVRFIMGSALKDRQALGRSRATSGCTGD